MSDVLIYVSPIVVALSTLAYRWLKFRLIWRVYSKGGREDAVAVANALRVLSGGKKPLADPLPKPETALRAVSDPQLERPG